MDHSNGRTPTTRTMLARRSVRTGFEPGPVAAGVIEEIVACGLCAPSSKNSQPWRLHVVTERDTLRAVAQAVLTRRGRARYVPHDPTTGRPRPEYVSTVVDSAQVLAEAPVVVFVENLRPFSAGLEEASGAALRSGLFGYGLEMVGCGAAVQNMWIAAEACGLRAVLLGDVAIAEEDVRPMLGLTGDLVGALAIGRSSTCPVPPMDAPAFPEVARAVWHGAAGQDGPAPAVAPTEGR